VYLARGKSVIVNDRDSKRTLDSDTGVYLTRAGGSLAEGIYSFAIHDGDTKLTIDPKRNLRETAPRTFVITYDLRDKPLIAGAPKRSGYTDLIRRLIEAFADYYGDWGGERGTFTTNVTIGAPFSTVIEAWERGNE